MSASSLLLAVCVSSFVSVFSSVALCDLGGAALAFGFLCCAR
jgi:hypothetical protein